MFSKLFGSRKQPEQEPETYKDFAVYPAAQKDSDGFRLAARVEKQVGGDLKVHHLIRADILNTQEAANAAAVVKAKQLIDQMGDRLFEM
ncbi:HlyU family transcriptional regulator [Yoonia sp.]|uniref:HlyU family transcriptional regulator n=1 Tax=Yoonia sp. TaxID=2212373 RepID=UPI0023B46A9D